VKGGLSLFRLAICLIVPLLLFDLALHIGRNSSPTSILPFLPLVGILLASLALALFRLRKL